MPIISEGDIIGCVASLSPIDGRARENISAELEAKLIMTASSFLGRQIEA